MKPTASAVGKFRRLWKEHYGEDITEEQATAYEERLVSLVKLMIDLEYEQKERPP